MIIDVDYIRRFRQVAKNIDDSRVEVYIREAEELDIMPAIGAELYQKYANIGTIMVGDGEVLQDEDGNDIVTSFEGDLPKEEYKLLNGGYYVSRCGSKKHIMGLKAALAYLSYARFVRNHSTQVTPFGVVVKEGDESSPATDRSIASVANDAQRIGEAYLKDCVEYWRSVNDDAERRATRKTRFTAIG